jgi:hypothetical protein
MNSEMRRLSPIVTSAICISSVCFSFGQFQTNGPIPLQPKRIVEAREYHDDRVRPPLTTKDCSGGRIGSSRLWVKVQSIDSVARVGKPFSMDVQIHNGTGVPVEIPIASSLREVEPRDPKLDYSWRTLGIRLHGIVGQERWQYSAGRVVLYGSKQTGTLLRLKPSEWITVHMTGKFGDTRYTVEPHDKIIETKIPVGVRLSVKLRAGFFESFSTSEYDARTRRETKTCGGVAQGGASETMIVLTN